jgi:CO/xanthine dehydrogenase FAD-binding subunit
MEALPDLSSTLSRLRAEPGIWKPFAGGTDLMVLLEAGKLPPGKYLSIWQLPELRGIAANSGRVTLGALTTYTQIRRHPTLASEFPLMARAASETGSIATQNRGTIGGNIANASPAGDTLPVLAAADAVVVAKSLAGERRIRFAEFYSGYRTAVLAADELIVGVEIPRIRGRQWFRKVGTRAAQSISKVVMAAIDGGRGPGAEAPRIALGSVAPVVIRLPRTEAALASGASIADAQRQLLDEIAPIDDVRSTAEYRRRVAANLLAGFWSSGRRR